MHDLGLDPAHLRCINCMARPAQGWDHAMALTRGGQWSGFGSMLDNLLPACTRCNSQKRNQDWCSFLHKSIPDSGQRGARIKLLERHMAHYRWDGVGHAHMQARCADKLAAVEKLRQIVVSSMRDAGAVIADIHRTVGLARTDRARSVTARGTKGA